MTEVGPGDYVPMVVGVQMHVASVLTEEGADDMFLLTLHGEQGDMTTVSFEFKLLRKVVTDILRTMNKRGLGLDGDPKWN